MLFLLAVTPLVAAAPPTLTNITPRGVERGKPVEVVIMGTNLTPQTKLLLPFKAVQELVPATPPNPAQARIRVTADPTAAIAAYPVRIWTEEGVSSPVLLCVDTMPSLNEAEDNNTFEKAQAIPNPIIVTGQIAGNNVDLYRFPVKKGQRVVVEIEANRVGSGLDPFIRIMDANRRFVGSASDTPGTQHDCRLILNIPADGDYVVEVQDATYRGGAPPHYRLKIGEYDVIEEVFPLGGRRGEASAFTFRGDSLPSPPQLYQILKDDVLHGLDWLRLDGMTRPGSLPPLLAVGDFPERQSIRAASSDPRELDVLPPVTLNGRLEQPGDGHRFQFAVTPGQRYRLAVEAERFGSPLDGVLRVTDQAGKQLALVDDVVLAAPAAGLQPLRQVDPLVDLTVPADARLLIVELRDQRGRGGSNYSYRLTIEPTIADFIVQQPVSQLTVPRGGMAVLTVPITRRGYTGPIQLTIPNLPPGLTVQGGKVPANASFGSLLVSAADGLPPAEPVPIVLQGRASIDGQDVRRDGEQALVLAQEGGVASSVLRLRGLPLGLAPPEPFTLRGPLALEVVKGYPTPVPVELKRAGGQEMLPVQLAGIFPTAVPLPAPGQPAAPPLAVPAVPKEGPVPAGMTAGTLSFDAAMTTPEGMFEMVLQGKAKVNNVDRVITGPIVTVSVARPFTVELVTPTLELKPGQMASVKARVHRREVFKEPVQFKLDGLPAGVTLAVSKPLAGDWTESQIDLSVDAKAAVAMVNLTLTASTTINGQMYAHPPVTIPAKVVVAK